MGHRLRSAALRALVPVIALSLTACATQPYVSWQLSPLPEGGNASLATAIQQAYDVRHRYEQALIAETTRRSELSNGLIVLGASILGLASLKAHRDAIVVAALGGSTAYTLGVWNQSRPREQIYIEAMKAMTCAVDAVLPLRFSAEDTRRLETGLDAIIASIARVNAQIAAAESLVDQVSDGKRKKSAQSDTANARALVDTANDTYVAGLGVLGNANNAGHALKNAIMSIGNRVDEALNGTIPDLSALPNVIKGLSATAEIFAPGIGAADTLAAAIGKGAAPTEELKTQATAATPAERLTTALDDLRREAIGLASQVRRVSGQIASLNAKRPIETLKSCGVQVDLALQVEPARLAFTEKQAGTKSVIVSGGKKPYVASVLDTPSPIGAQSPLVGDSAVRVTATDKTEAGATYSVLVQDAAGQRMQIAVLIQAAAKPGADDTSAGAQDGGAAAAKPAARSADEIRLAQRFLCTAADGVVGPGTQLALEVFQLETAEGAPAGLLSDAELARIKQLAAGATACGADRLNYYEKGLDAAAIDALRKALGLAASGGIDAPMRDKIKAFVQPAEFPQDARGKVALKAKAAGQLTSLVKSAILK